MPETLRPGGMKKAEPTKVDPARPFNEDEKTLLE